MRIKGNAKSKLNSEKALNFNVRDWSASADKFACGGVVEMIWARAFDALPFVGR
jgi:hypothetical protein